MAKRLPVIILLVIILPVVILLDTVNPFAANVATILLANVPPTCIETFLFTVSVPNVRLPPSTYK